MNKEEKKQEEIVLSIDPRAERVQRFLDMLDRAEKIGLKPMVIFYEPNTKKPRKFRVKI